MFRFEDGFQPVHPGILRDSLDSLIDRVLKLDEPFWLDGVKSQLKPKSWLKMLVSGSGVDPDIHFIIQGLMEGFKVVDYGANVDPYCW